MPQKIAKEFLVNNDPARVYAFFLKATQIEKVMEGVSRQRVSEMSFARRRKIVKAALKTLFASTMSLQNKRTKTCRRPAKYRPNCCKLRRSGVIDKSRTGRKQMKAQRRRKKRPKRTR